MQSIRIQRIHSIIKLDQRIEIPPKKEEERKSGAEHCILKIGRQNNVVQWMEDMQNETCGLYGMTGMFFSTKKRYVHPYPREEDYNPPFKRWILIPRQRVSKMKTGRKTKMDP